MKIDYKIGDILIHYDMFYSDVGAVFDSAIRDTSERIGLFTKDQEQYVIDTESKESYILACNKLLNDLFISHHKFSKSNREVTIGEFVIDNKKVFSHISRHGDYYIVSSIEKFGLIVKEFENGQFKRTKKVFIEIENEFDRYLIQLEKLVRSYSYDESYDLWIKWLDKNFENIKTGRVNALAI